MRSFRWLALALMLTADHQAEQWFGTGQPQLVASDVGLIPLMTWADYSALAGSLTGPRQVPLKERPPLSEQARFGVNFVLAGKNRALAIDGSDAAGWRFYADTNADGKLTSGEGIPMQRVDGKLTVEFHTTAVETRNGATDRYPVDLTFTVDTATPPGDMTPVTVLRRRGTTVRRGVIQLGSARVPFALLGHAGIYDQPASAIVFDLRGHGLDLTDERSPDRFQVREGKVDIGGATYQFRVDRYGRGLALSAMATKLPARPTLAVGSAAPDFAFTDLAGGKHRLSDFRGRPVLLVFWATWCGPCRAEAPAIAAAYERFKDRGLVLVGMNPNDPLPDVRDFLDQFHVAGLTAREPMDGPSHALFRVLGWPSQFLIGKDGRIIANQIDPTRLNDLIAAALR